MSGLVFIIMLLIVSGFVAWAGDVLGRNLGRRRISLFGIRPRRTSVLIAILTGMIITGGTILAAFLASERVRQMLTELDQIIDDRNSAIAQRDEAYDERDQAIVALDVLQTQVHDITAQLEYTQIEISTVRDERDLLVSEVSELITANQELREEYDQIVAEGETQIAQLEDQLAQLNNQVDLLSTTTQTLNVQIAEAEERISVREQRLQDLDAAIVHLEWNIVRMQLGEVKVIEGQQLGVVLINTNLDQATIYDLLQGWVLAIPDSFRDPETGEVVLEGNRIIEISNEEYYRALQEIKAIPAPRAAVIAYSTANVFEDESITLRIEITGYYKVFPAGIDIYSDIFEQSQEISEPYRATIAGFLGDAKVYLVNERGFIPMGSGDVIQLTVDQMIELSETLSEVGFPAEIRMTALRDIYNTNFLLYGDHFTVDIIPGTSVEP